MSRSVLLLLVALACIACTAGRQDSTVSVEPDALDDGWPVSTLEAEGVSVSRMVDVQEFIRRDPHNDLMGLLIARNGKLVYEGYFNGHDRDTLHDIRSATKSLTSALVGIAIANDIIGGVDASMVQQLSTLGLHLRDEEEKRKITIEHLLTMASGMDADEDDPTSAGFEDSLYESSDWVRFAFDLPMSDPPGKKWAYASVNTVLLGLIIEVATEKSLSAFAEDRLFDPMGITEYRWASTPSGRTVAQGNLSLRLRDLAKVGQLFLDRGRWAGRQVVPEEWVQASVVGRYSVPWDGYDEYGYGWYLHRLAVEGQEFPYFSASGNGGNKVYVLPGQRMLVVIQSAAYNTDYGQCRSLDVLRKVLEALVAAQRDVTDEASSSSIERANTLQYACG
jgi:CubicO group peptidase (beta-lactamase class C family)